MLPFIIASGILVFFLSLFPITDFDIWWHLAGGKIMLETLQFPYEDPFSYTAQGAPWFPNSWGFTAFSYAAFKFIGLQGLNIIKALIVAVTFFVAVFFLYRQKVLTLLSLGFLVLAFFTIREGLSLRPHTFSYLFFVVFLVLLFEYQKYRHRKGIASLGIVQVIWTNMHASFVFGPIFTFLFLLSETIRTKKIDRKNVILGITVFAASLLHFFYGANYLIRIIRDVFNPTASQVPVRDLLPATPDTFLSLVGIVLLAAIPLLFFSIKTKQFFIGAFFFFLLGIAILNVRFTRELVLFVGILAPMSLPLLKSYTTKWKIAFPSWAPKVAFIIFLVAIFFLAKTSALGIGLGLSQYSYPIKAVEFIQENQILEQTQGNLYHTYNFGGYLIWANQPYGVFIDGRVRPYHGDVFAAYWTNFEGGRTWQESIGRYDITAALMTLPHTDGTTVYNISSPMFPLKDWALVYYDDIASLYVRRVEELQEFILSNEYKILNPQSLDLTYLQEYVQSQETFEEVVNEIQRALFKNPDTYRLHFTLAYVYSLAGLQEAMTDELNKTLEINPHFKQAKDILEQI